MWKSWTENGTRFKQWIDDDAPRQVVRKRVAPVSVDEAIAYYVAKGIPRDIVASGIHKLECAEKAHLKEENPVDVERNRKLAWLDAEAKRLRKLGGMSANAAIDQAGRNWADQNNSPGSR
jgi:hypothetical protein